MFVLFVGPLIFVVNGLDFHCDLLHLVESSVVHSLLEGVLSDELFNVETGFLEVNFEEVDLLSEVEDGVLVDVVFDPNSKREYLCSFSALSLSCCRS